MADRSGELSQVWVEGQGISVFTFHLHFRIPQTLRTQLLRRSDESGLWWLNG